MLVNGLSPEVMFGSSGVSRFSDMVGTTQSNVITHSVETGVRLDAAAELVRGLKECYIKRNPLSSENNTRACRSLPGGNTRSVLHFDPFPITFRGGHGCHVTSIDGGEYLDMVSESTASLMGHSHPVVQQAILDATTYGMNLGGCNEYEVELAEVLVARFKSVDSIRFSNSGTEAKTIALAAAKHYTGKSKVLVFKDGYHGSTLTFHELDNPMNIPHSYIMAEFNDFESTRKVLLQDMAAIIVEPIQGAGSMIPASKDFLTFLRESADKIGAVLIFDEVVTSH
ncbi:hypothetical protein AAFC00_000757 [Neodothiora populina]|uniref:Uncharacterized protein n=1 Tax=Neodothiora populina TaxID=2781224 RepID=A0ABR3PLX4_9PEZI